MKMTKLVFIRHGQSDHNLNTFSFLELGKKTKSTLTDRGRQEVEATAKELLDCRPEIIYSSPLIRAVQTARIIQARFKSKNIALEIKEDGRLNQLGFNFHKKDKDPKQEINSLVDQIKNEHYGQTVLIVGHFHTYYLLLVCLFGMKSMVGSNGLLKNRLKTGQYRQILIKA